MLIDLHTHTRFGSRCASQTPAQLLSLAKRTGLDGVCFTEHEVAWTAGELRALADEFDMLVLGGMELKTPHGEVLVIGVDRPLFHVSNPSELRELVNQAGGIIIAAHPFRGYMFVDDMNGGHERFAPGTFLTLAAACNHPILEQVDAVEVFNGMATPREAIFTRRVAHHLGLPGTGGSDTHQPHSVGWCVTEFERTLVSEEEFVAEFKAGNYRAIHRQLNNVGEWCGRAPTGHPAGK